MNKKLKWSVIIVVIMLSVVTVAFFVVYDAYSTMSHYFTFQVRITEKGKIVSFEGEGKSSKALFHLPVLLDYIYQTADSSKVIETTSIISDEERLWIHPLRGYLIGYYTEVAPFPELIFKNDTSTYDVKLTVGAGYEKYGLSSKEVQKEFYYVQDNDETYQIGYGTYKPFTDTVKVIHTFKERKLLHSLYAHNKDTVIIQFKY